MFDTADQMVADHTVNLPDSSASFPACNGYDPHSASWRWNVDGDLEMEWDGIVSPSPEASSYRLVMDHIDGGGVYWESFNYLDGETTSLTLDGELFSGLGSMWELPFQQRFENPDGTAHNFNW